MVATDKVNPILQKNRQKYRKKKNFEKLTKSLLHSAPKATLQPSDIISPTLDLTTNSMPEISDDDDEQTIMLKDKLQKLESELCCAQSHIRSLTLENERLRGINIELQKENEKHNDSPVNIIEKTKMQNTNNNSKRKISRTKDTSEHENKQVEPKNKEMNLISLKPTQVCVSNTKESSLVICPETQRKDETTSLTSSRKHKLCLISSETSNRLYTIIANTHLSNYEICHYRKPKCGLKHLFDNIENKVQDFTKFDFCVIYIGEEDFRITHNYIEHVKYIRQKISLLNNTNFIICLPTFKYMNNSNIMFNSRVDAFNNILYKDAETYDNTYILDSNLNLPYTYETYNRRLATLNYKGLRIIMSDLLALITDISVINTMHPEVGCLQENNTQTSITSIQENSQFFL